MKGMRFLAVAPALAVGTALGTFPAVAQEAPAGGDAHHNDEETIIVTAQRRGEDLQRTPMQINVIGGDALTTAGVTQLRSLQVMVPGINLQQAGPYTQFAIRGVSTTVTTPFQDAAVAFNLDDVYMARPVGTSSVFYDIERVEVLKGPQGTLYGRNATAGAVNVVTVQPRLENSFGANIEYGSYDQLVLNGFANLQVGPASAVRAAFQVAQRDGYYDDGYDDQDSVAGRLQFRSEPTPGLTITLGADYAREKGQGFGVVPYPAPGGNPWSGMSSTQVQDYVIANLQIPYKLVTPTGRTHLIDFGADGFIHHVAWGLRGKLDWDIGPATVTAIGAWRKTSIDDAGYPGGFLTAPDYTAKQTSFETRIASNDGPSPLQWLVGFYYFREEINGEQTTVFVDGATSGQVLFGSRLLVSPLTDETFAFFTQNSLAVTHRFRLTAGLRYFEETKTNDGSNTSYSPFPPVSGSYVVTGSGRLDYKKVNYRLAAELDAGADSMLYASVADGFKAGGFYTGAAPSDVNPTPNTYRPATLTAYTIGMRNRFLDRRLTFNVEAFYWDYRDRQYVTFGPVNTGTALNLSGAITINVGKSHIQGLSLESSFRPAPDTRISANVEYIDEAVNDDFVFASTQAAGTGCTALEGGMVDCSGTPITLVPRWSATFGFEQGFRFGTRGRVVFDLRSKVESRTLLGPEQRADQYQKAYTRTDLGLTYHAADDRWSIGAFVRNLEDHVIRTSALLSPITATPWSDLLPPRTWGVRAGLKF